MVISVCDGLELSSRAQVGLVGTAREFRTSRAHLSMAASNADRTMSNASLLASLESHNSAFEALLSLIPARHYIRDETVDDEVRSKPRSSPPVGLLLRREQTWLTVWPRSPCLNSYLARQQVHEEQEEQGYTQTGAQRAIQEGKEGQGKLTFPLPSLPSASVPCSPGYISIKAHRLSPSSLLTVPVTDVCGIISFSLRSA